MTVSFLSNIAALKNSKNLFCLTDEIREERKKILLKNLNITNDNIKLAQLNYKEAPKKDFTLIVHSHTELLKNREVAEML